MIGLVDGRYEDVAAPWHKEILFALSHGVHVVGGASIGALRAAECAAFGMLGIGRIYQAYISGERVDDADVAQLHGPAELDYLPVTEVLVNVEETFRGLARSHLLETSACEAPIRVAGSTSFKHLTFDSVIAQSKCSVAEQARIGCLARLHRIDLKRQDAFELVETMTRLPSARTIGRPGWRLSEPVVWARYISQLEATVLAPLSAANC